ncbi:MAG: phosphate acyltransferase PlsX [Clostridia bacterium]
MKIIIDAMGGDNAPSEIVKGAIDAMQLNPKIEILFVGEQEKIQSNLSKLVYDKSKVTIVNATQVIENDDSPIRSLRSKPDSSLVLSFGLLKDKSGDVLISAGNTGAIVAGATLLLGKIDGVDRPALTTIVPNKSSFSLLLDAGANPTCRAENYFDFGIMGYQYMKQVCGIDDPKVYLLNVGIEENKGNETVKAAYKLLEDAPINFMGNIEGRSLPEGIADVIVTDGFTGNVAIKVLEGTAMFMANMVKDIINTSFVTKLSGLIMKDDLKVMKLKLDYAEYGGAPLLGVRGKVIKCHGSSNAKAIRNAIIKFGCNYAESSIIEDLEEEFRGLEKISPASD